MSRANFGIYLGKAGQIYGPYKDEEIDELRSSGRLSDFTWIWDHAANAWKSLELPPQMPPMPPQDGGAVSKSTHTHAAAPAQARQLSSDPIQVVCHDYRSIVSGTLKNVTQTGCEIVCTDPSTSPRFPDRGNILINLLNERSGTSMNVQAKLSDIFRNGGAWTYRVRWDRCPDILMS